MKPRERSLHNRIVKINTILYPSYCNNQLLVGLGGETLDVGEESFGGILLIVVNVCVCVL